MKKPKNPDLRERLRGFGADSLSDVELVALVLGHGRRGEPLQMLAGRLLWETGGLKAMTGREARELERIPGIGPATAARLEAVLELGRRLCRPALEVGEPLHCANDAARHFHGLLSGVQREEFHCLMLDSRHKVLGSRLVSVGTLQSSIVHPREVFRPAIRQSAATLVVAHNHPSGDPSPSEEDRAITARLREVGTLVGIQLLDHLVIGERQFYSFAEEQVRELETG